MLHQFSVCSNASIVNGSGEGIPSTSSGDTWWHEVLWATSCSPVLCLIAAVRSEWLGMALLLTTFVVPFFAIVIYRHQHGTTNRLRFLASAAVSGSNLVTWIILWYFPEIYASISVEKTLILAELLIPLTILYIAFGAFRSVPATRSSDDDANDEA